MITVKYSFNDELIPEQAMAKLCDPQESYTVYNHESIQGAYIEAGEIVISGTGKIIKREAKAVPEVLRRLVMTEHVEVDTYLTTVLPGTAFSMMVGLAVGGTFMDAKLTVENQVST